MAAFERVIGTKPDFEPKFMMRTLLGYLMNGLSKDELAQPVVQRIIEIAEE